MGNARAPWFWAQTHPVLPGSLLGQGLSWPYMAALLLIHVTTCPVRQERGPCAPTPPVICSLSPRARWGGWISLQTWSLLQASPLRVTSRCLAVSHRGTGGPPRTRRNPLCDLCGSRPWNSPPHLACETLQNHQAGRLVFPLLLKNRQAASKSHR